MPPIMPPTTGVGPAITDFPEISRGAKGEEVADIQKLLNDSGANLKVDGDWGPKTDKAVRAFQREHGLKVDGIAGPKTMEALTAAQAAKTGATGGVIGGNTGKFDLDRQLSSPDSKLSVAIGNAEGTRTPNGGHTPAYNHHTDPGNGAANYGTFSKQNGPTNPKAADQAQLREFRNFRPQYEKACKAAGLDPNDKLLAASTFDLYNQAPKAVTDKGGFLDQLPTLAKNGVTPENIVKARVQSYFDPDTQKYDVADVLKAPGALKADQLRRTNAIQDVLQQPDPAMKIGTRTGDDGAIPGRSSVATGTATTKPASAGPGKTSLNSTGTRTGDEGTIPGRSGGATGTATTKPTPTGPVPGKISLNSKGPEVAELKQALKDAGFYNGPINETMGHQGIEALKNAKQAIGIGGPADVAGPETIRQISDYAKSTNLHVNVDFVSQFDPRVPPDPGNPTQSPALRCDNACQYMMENNKSGKKITPGDSKAYEHSYTGKGAADPQVQYVENQLRAGNPVMIGVHHPYGTPGTNNTNGANHYLVATGMGSDSKGRYITYNNPVKAANDEAHGKDTNPENRLYLRNGQFEQLGSSDPYQLRCVVENKTAKPRG